jgi:hypothetical protein
VLGRTPTMLCLKKTIIGFCLSWKCGLCACKTGCNHVVSFPIEEMVQEPFEDYCEHS